VSLVFSRVLPVLACSSLMSMFTLTATPCTGGTLAGYIALGSTGCTIGNDTFFNFELVADSGTGGATPISASSIDVEGYGPAGTSGASAVAPYLSNDIGIDFGAAWATTAGQSLEDDVAFDVSVGNGAAEITDAGIIQESSVTGNGSVTVAEEGCSGVVFPCTQQWGVATNDTGFVADTIFSATGTLSVEKDIAVVAGTGTASVTSVADLFSTTEVPEPRALSLLLALGLAAGLILRNYFVIRSRKSLAS